MDGGIGGGGATSFALSADQQATEALIAAARKAVDKVVSRFQAVPHQPTGPTRARLELDAPAVTCPVLFVAQWDDELFERASVFALFEALGSADKRLHAFPGRHGAVSTEAFADSAAFLVRHLAGSAERA